MKRNTVTLLKYVAAAACILILGPGIIRTFLGEFEFYLASDPYNFTSFNPGCVTGSPNPESKKPSFDANALPVDPTEMVKREQREEGVVSVAKLQFGPLSLPVLLMRSLHHSQSLWRTE